MTAEKRQDTRDSGARAFALVALLVALAALFFSRPCDQPEQAKPKLGAEA